MNAVEPRLRLYMCSLSELKTSALFSLFGYCNYYSVLSSILRRFLPRHLFTNVVFFFLCFLLDGCLHVCVYSSYYSHHPIIIQQRLGKIFAGTIICYLWVAFKEVSIIYLLGFTLICRRSIIIQSSDSEQRCSPFRSRIHICMYRGAVQQRH